MQLKEDLEREEDDVLDRDETDDELEVQLQSANFVFRQLLELAQGANVGFLDRDAESAAALKNSIDGAVGADGRHRRHQVQSRVSKDTRR